VVQAEAIRAMRAAGTSSVKIARDSGIRRSSVYGMLKGSISTAAA
jgi:hypothetical protein